MTKIFLSKQFTYLQSYGFTVEEHHHIAPQVFLASPGDTISSNGLEGRGLFFGSEVPHAVDSEKTLHSFLVNPVYSRARILNRDSCIFTPPEGAAERLVSLNFEPSDDSYLQELVDTMLSQIAGDDREPQELDERIAEVVAYIDELEQKRVAAGELAEQIALSESRFLHLFKEEMKLTVRKYLLWTRMVAGTRQVVEGSTITEAAHSSGFTDSAHFARVFKQMFGVTLSTALVKEPKATLVVGEL